MSCREILGPCLPGSTCRAPEAYAIARLERGHRRLHIQRAKHEANFHHLCLPISASLLRLQRCATMLQIFFWEPRPPFDSPTIALHTIAPRIISIWHSVDNSWSLFIYKSFVDFLSNRTGKKKGKRFFVVYFPFKKLFQAPLESNRIDVFANNRSGSPGPRSLIYLAPLLVLSRPETEPN